MVLYSELDGCSLSDAVFFSNRTIPVIVVRSELYAIIESAIDSNGCCYYCYSVTINMNYIIEEYHTSRIYIKVMIALSYTSTRTLRKTLPLVAVEMDQWRRIFPSSRNALCECEL